MLFKKIAIGIAFSLALAGSAAADNVLHIGETATLPDLNPFILAPAYEPMEENVFDTLTRYDKDLKPQPRLAKSWAFSDDGKKLTLHLRSGVKFHDGKPFTSKDVVNTLAYVKDPSHGALISGFADRVVSIDAPDKLTAVMNFDKPFPGVFDLLELLFIVDTDHADFSKSANGTGAFEVVSHQPGVKSVFKANKDYWDGAPRLDGFDITTVPNQQAELLSLRSGDLDYVSELGFVDLAPFRRDDSFKTGAVSSGVVHDITINMRSKPLSIEAVREAIDLSIDRKRIAKLLFGDLSQPWCEPFGKNSIAYVASSDDCTFDLDTAKKVLQSAGVKLPLTLTILTSSEIRTEYTTISEILQADLAKIGITLKIENVDAVTYRKKYVQEHDFQLVSHAFGRAEKDPSSLLETTVVFEPKGNVSGFESQAYTDAVNAGGSTVDPAKRKAAYAKATKIIRDTHAVLTLVPRPRLYVTPSTISGLSFTADGFAVLQKVTKEQ